MSESEREDYDDEFDSKKVPSQNLIRLRQAENCWIFVWIWFLIGVFSVLGLEAIRLNVSLNGILVLLVHILMAGCFFWGGYFIRQGSVNSLWVVAVGSTLIGLGYGACGTFAGLMMSSGFAEDDGPDYAERTQGIIVVVWTALSLLWGLVALVFTIRYAIFEDQNASLKRNDPKRNRRDRS